jgi:hypothetical protein
MDSTSNTYMSDAFKQLLNYEQSNSTNRSNSNHPLNQHGKNCKKQKIHNFKRKPSEPSIYKIMNAQRNRKCRVGNQDLMDSCRKRRNIDQI